MNTESSQADLGGLQKLCQEIYRETAKFYEAKAPQLGSEAALGYAILYGPPVYAPGTLFLGFQPGGGELDAKQGLESGERDGWPDRIHYATENWKLAKVMRNIWHPSTLDNWTGLNEIFFRSPKIKVWKKVPLGLRRELESFCHIRARSIVKAMAPKRIVVIGLGTFNKLAGRKHQIVHQEGKNVLIKQGVIWDVPAIGIIHLSGRYNRTEEIDALIKHFSIENVKLAPA